MGDDEGVCGKGAAAAVSGARAQPLCKGCSGLPPLGGGLPPADPRQ